MKEFSKECHGSLPIRVPSLLLPVKLIYTVSSARVAILPDAKRCVDGPIDRELLEQKVGLWARLPGGRLEMLLG